MLLCNLQIDSLLRGGARDLLEEDDDTALSASKQYANEDIERLMTDCSHEVKVDQGSQVVVVVVVVVVAVAVAVVVVVVKVVVVIILILVLVVL